MKNIRIKIHKEGKRIIPAVFIILLLLFILIRFLSGNGVIFYALTAVLIFLFGLVVWFFREPQVEIDQNRRHILSVADGKVVVIEPSYEKEYFKDERIQVSVFMSLFNPHVNYVPFEGKIIYRNHRNGRFHAAYVPKSSEENERCTTVIKAADGTEILIRQIAGTVARRVMTYGDTGDKVKQGEQLGFIRFGSRVDLFLPKSVNINVKLNEKVAGGKSVIATFD